MADSKENMSDDGRAFYKALVTAGRVKRWHTVDTVATQNVADHTYGVMATLVYITDGEASKELLLAALYHDVLEGITGDLPHPFKKLCPDEVIRMEGIAANQLPEGFESIITQDEMDMLKVADLLEMGVWATYELVLGNAGALKIMVNILRALSGMTVNDRAMVIIESLEANVAKYTKGGKDAT